MLVDAGAEKDSTDPEALNPQRFPKPLSPNTDPSKNFLEGNP